MDNARQVEQASGWFVDPAGTRWFVTFTNEGSARCRTADGAMTAAYGETFRRWGWARETPKQPRKAPTMPSEAKEATGDRYITLWRKADSVLDWDFHVSEDSDSARRVVGNITAQGVHQYRTYILGDKLPDLSSEY